MALDESFEIGEVMEIGRNENEKPANQVEEEPGDRKADGHPESSPSPAGFPLIGLGGDEAALKTVGAKKFARVLGDAFPAKEVGARRTAGDSFPVRMVQTTLES